MSNTKGNKGLGRGLAALIGDGKVVPVDQVPAASDADSGLITTNFYLLVKLPATPSSRARSSTTDALAELAESIKAVGLVQPVVVRRHGDSYELVAGERRWRAAQLAGLEKIPAVIREAGEAESLELALIENLSREDLNPIDTARAYAILQEDFGATQEELAGKLGRSRSAVANTLRLLDLPDEVQTLIEQGKPFRGTRPRPAVRVRPPQATQAGGPRGQERPVGPADGRAGQKGGRRRAAAERTAAIHPGRPGAHGRDHRRSLLGVPPAGQGALGEPRAAASRLEFENEEQLQPRSSTSWIICRCIARTDPQPAKSQRHGVADFPA